VNGNKSRKERENSAQQMTTQKSERENSQPSCV
jgi:hypothetical protein